VNRARDQLLAGTCFALDKRGGIRRGDLSTCSSTAFQSGTATYDLLESARINILVSGFESAATPLKPPAQPDAHFYLWP